LGPHYLLQGFQRLRIETGEEERISETSFSGLGGFGWALGHMIDVTKFIMPASANPTLPFLALLSFHVALVSFIIIIILTMFSD
jgi:hypothetical protein